jgi:hypothetical protein
MSPLSYIAWIITFPPVILISIDLITLQFMRSYVSVAVPTYLPSKAVGAAGPCADEVAAGTASPLRIPKALGKPRNLIAVPRSWRARAAFDINPTARNFKS